MPKKFRNVTILLPAMDETYSLKETVDTIIETNKDKDLCEIIFLLCERTSRECVCTAKSLCEIYGDKLPMTIHYQTLPFVGGAIREGFDLAKGSHVVLMSADLETDPHVIKDFVEKSKQYPNAIITASRWKNGGGFKGYSKLKLILNYIFQKMIAVMFFTSLTDITYAFRIFPTALVKKIQWEELKHPFFLETAIKPLRLRVRFIEISAKWNKRTEGVSQNSFFANFKYFKTAWHVRFMKKQDIWK